MRRSCCTSWFLWSLVWTVVVLVPATLLAGDGPQKKLLPKGEVVQLFSAAEKGLIDVELIAKGSAKCRLIVTNKTDRPLNVQLPEAFAGVPVLAQRGMMNNNFRQNNAPLQRLQLKDSRKAELIKLRFFAGLTNRQAADALGISASTADADWAYAKSWLRLEMTGRA